MKTKVLKFTRNNLYMMHGVWLVKESTWRPFYAMMICQALNERRALILKYNSKK